MLPIRWKRAEGTRPGLSLTTLRYLRRLLLRPSSMASSSGFPHGALLEAVAFYPAVLLGATELRPDLR